MPILCREMGSRAQMCCRGHKCAATVQLHAVQELWGLFQGDSLLDTGSDLDEADVQVNMMLSQEAAMLGSALDSSSRTLKFLGTIQGNEVVILVDSGSSNSFINAKLAPSLAGLSHLSRPVRVQVANGQVLQCVSEFQTTEWSIQGMLFVSDLRVLPLPYYMI
jgi:hypothetical protein